MDTRSAQLVFHFFIEELAVSHEATLRNCCVTRPDPFGIPGPPGPSAHDCSGLPRFCPLVNGERLSPSSAFLQANGRCPGAAPASVKEPCESGFRSGPPPLRPVLAARRRTHHQAITAILYTIRRPPRNCGPCRLSQPTTCCPRINTNFHEYEQNPCQFVKIRGHPAGACPHTPPGPVPMSFVPMSFCRVKRLPRETRDSRTKDNGQPTKACSSWSGKVKSGMLTSMLHLKLPPPPHPNTSNLSPTK